MTLKIFYSNRIEYLYEQLKERLFTSTSPFERRLVIVPTPAIKSWLTLQLANDIGISAGLEVLYLSESLKKIYSLVSKTKDTFHYPNQLEITLAIESHILQIASNWLSLTSDQKKCWQSLFEYLKISSLPREELSRQSQRRLTFLAHTVAQLFLEYSKYGLAMTESWVDQEDAWQQELWKALFSSFSWSYPSKDYQSVELDTASLENIQINLFSISFISKSEHDFLNRISNFTSIHYYILSPSHLFWEDILTDRESKKIQQFWKKKNVSIEQQNTLESYLEDKNPLLANWGKLGRKVIELLGDDLYETFSDYFLPSSLQELEPYQSFEPNLHWEESKNPSTLLEKVQADILLMRNPKEHPKIEIEKDLSIQLHLAPSKQREVQILYQNILHLIHCDNTLKPSDIIVMAPNINEYSIYIHQLFGSESSQLDYQLMDLQSASETSISQQLLCLLQVSFSRWDIETIIKIFNLSFFQKKHQLSSEDLFQIEEWIKTTGIRWGENSSHRNEILQLRHCQTSYEESQQGTWEEGFSKLLSGLALLKSDTFHVPSIESSSSELLGKFIQIIRSLKKDLKPFNDGTSKTYQEWVSDFKKILETYLTNDLEEENCETLLNQLHSILQASQWIPNHKVTFSSIYFHLENLVNSPSASHRENHLQSVKFCSMQPMRAVPAKIIALIGLDEENFPRKDIRSSLDLMKANPLCDYRPSKTDFDRYLFLETLLSVRKHFILSYTAYSPTDGKEQKPSLIVKELMNYMDQTYQINGSNVSSMISFSHPYYSFDSQYFCINSSMKNYSQQDYRLAQNFYLREKKPAHQFISDFTSQNSISLNKQDITLTIQQIKTSVHNPFKTFFNTKLGIYIQEEEVLQKEDSFTLTPLQLYDLKKTSLKKDVTQTLQEAEKNGYLPLGLFKETAKSTIHQAVKELHDKLTKMKVSSNEIFEIELHEQYQEVIRDDAGWKLPPIELSYENQPVKIVGKFNEVSEEGLIAHIKGTKEDITKVYGEWIVFNHLINIYQLPCKKQLLCTKTGNVKTTTEDSLEVLKKILDYYFKTTQHISPLTTEWIQEILGKDSEILKNTVLKSLNNVHKPIYNEYLKYACRSNKADLNIGQHWKELAQELLKDFAFE